MSAPEWQRLLADSRFLGELYEGSAPAPEACELSYVHLDERGDSVTLGFDTRHLPSRPDQGWHESPYNRFEFYLLFSGVTDFQVNGWTDSEAREVNIRATPEALIAVSLGHEGSGIDFRASSMRLAHARVYLAAEGS
jgi:hypothetical protein